MTLIGRQPVARCGPEPQRFHVEMLVMGAPDVIPRLGQDPVHLPGIEVGRVPLPDRRDLGQVDQAVGRDARHEPVGQRDPAGGAHASVRRGSSGSPGRPRAAGRGPAPPGARRRRSGSRWPRPRRARPGPRPAAKKPMSSTVPMPRQRHASRLLRNHRLFTHSAEKLIIVPADRPSDRMSRQASLPAEWRTSDTLLRMHRSYVPPGTAASSHNSTCARVPGRPRPSSGRTGCRSN